MNFFDVFTYGFIQGVTEFLPVSSSGHLAILPKLLGIDDPGVTFDLAMHVGTALAVGIYFHKEVVQILKGFFSVLKKKSLRNLNEQESYSSNIIFSTFISFTFIMLIKDFAESFGRESSVLAFNLILFGIIMWVADRFFKEDKSLNFTSKLEIKKAGLIGLFQAFAVFPGVSRSGGTLTISRFLGLPRDTAARFSFLLSLPIIFAGFTYKLLKMDMNALQFDIGSCLLGIVISFIVGLITIHFFLKVIARFGLGLFSLYRVIIGLLILIYL